MNRQATRILVVSCLLLVACEDSEQTAKPLPQTLTREAVGHYCQMIVADHQGPKAQIFLSDREAPVWFSSVRDAVAFTLLPEEPKNVTAVYVTDMAVASWDSPGPDTWIEAETAHFVIESDRRGGMGALEAVPFGDPAAAESFILRHGGRLVSYAEIPESYILSADEDPATIHQHEAHGHGAGDHEEHDEQGEAQHGSTH